MFELSGYFSVVKTIINCLPSPVFSIMITCFVTLITAAFVKWILSIL